MARSIQRRRRGQALIIELVPLPTSAQFLNVIEGVFTGMTKAVIHNSDYHVWQGDEISDITTLPGEKRFLQRQSQACRKEDVGYRLLQRLQTHAGG